MAEDTGETDSSKYKNPFSSAGESFQNYNNILVDFEISLIKNNITLAKENTKNSLPSFNLY
jgi:hypothetical protein